MNKTLSPYYKFVTATAKVIGLLAPSYAKSYLRNHMQLRGYDAAVTFGNVNQDWRPGLLPGDREIGKSFQISTERSRDLARNNPLVKEALKVGFAFTIGTALDPQFNIITAEKKRDIKNSVTISTHSAVNAFEKGKKLQEKRTMKFEQFCRKLGIDAENLADARKIALESLFEARCKDLTEDAEITPDTKERAQKLINASDEERARGVKAEAELRHLLTSSVDFSMQ